MLSPMKHMVRKVCLIRAVDVTHTQKMSSRETSTPSFYLKIRFFLFIKNK